MGFPYSVGLLIIAIIFFLQTAYIRFWLSREGTAHAHPRSIRYRSPQIPWAFLVLTLFGWWGPGSVDSLPFGYPLMMAYYAFRFGTLRAFSLGVYLGVSLAAFYIDPESLVDILWGSGAAVVVSLATDLYWNWDFKRRGIEIPGADPEPA